ncbi:MAG: pyridoxamine kinase [Cellulosilyticaceae bacterium]
MQNKVPRIATIQTLAGFGRCSLTVAIPILSAMGIQVCPIPTVVLSTHTGGLGKPVSMGMTDIIDEWTQHWKTLNLTFDALTSGFLGNEHQIQQVIQLFQTFKTPQNFVLVDPVMGDNGKHYDFFTKQMQNAMKKLIASADIVTPNLTELYLLLGKPYTENVLKKEEIRECVLQIALLGPRYVVVKGVFMEEGKVNVCFDSQKNKMTILPYETINAHYHGTGDAFASIVTGALLQGKSLVEAVQKAADFIRYVLKYTDEANVDSKEGILIEPCLGELIINSNASCIKK